MKGNYEYARFSLLSISKDAVLLSTAISEFFSSPVADIEVVFCSSGAGRGEAGEDYCSDADCDCCSYSIALPPDSPEEFVFLSSFCYFNSAADVTPTGSILDY